MKTLKKIIKPLLLTLSILLISNQVKSQDQNGFSGFDPEDLIAINKWVMNGGTVKLPDHSKFTEVPYKTLHDSIQKGELGGFIGFYVKNQDVKGVRDLVLSARTVNKIRDHFTSKEVQQHVEIDNSRSVITVPTSFRFSFHEDEKKPGIKILTITWVINTKDLTE